MSYPPERIYVQRPPDRIPDIAPTLRITEPDMPIWIAVGQVYKARTGILESGKVVAYDLASANPNAYPGLTCIGRGRYYSYGEHVYPNWENGDLVYFFAYPEEDATDGEDTQK